MKIPVGDKYQISTDAHNWMFQERTGTVKSGDRAGEPTWNTWGYWGTLEAMVKALPDMFARRLDGIGLDSFSAIRNDIQALESALKRQRSLIFEAMGWL